MPDSLLKTARKITSHGGKSGKMMRVKMAPLSGVVFAICRYLKANRERVVLVVSSRKEGEEAVQSAETFGFGEYTRLFTHYELNPYETSSPDPEIVAGRVETLFSVMGNRCRLLVSTAEAFSSFAAPPEDLREKKIELTVEMEQAPDELVGWLVEAGYQRIPEVSDPGDFSVRGGIIDVFSPAVGLPVRVEYGGDQVDSIRLFDPSSQRTVRKVGKVFLYPASEIVWSGSRQVSSSPVSEKVKAFVKSGIRYPGIEYYVPHIYGRRGSLLDYFEDNPQIIFYDHSEIQNRQEFLAELAREIYEKREEELPLPGELYLDKDGVEGLTADRVCIEIDTFLGENGEKELYGIDISPVGGPTFPLKSPLKLKRFLELLSEVEEKDLTCYIALPNPYRLEVMEKMLEEYEYYPSKVVLPRGGEPIQGPGIFLLISGIRTGFYSKKASLMVTTDHEIFGRRGFSGAADPHRAIKEGIVFDTFRENDFVVHETYGIGIFKGLKTMKVDDNLSDFGIIEYDSGDLLYLPIYRLDLIQRYVGSEGGAPKLDRLGTRRWELTKKRIKEKAQKVAAELLLINAAREVSEGFSFDPPDAVFEDFAAGFEFEETPDQESAIKKVFDDMAEAKPMDRLICGDVGYGKTEVALRASFLAVMSGKQVAFLCPTTVLAQQHFRTFRERFDKFPVRVEVLSRFVKSGEQKKILRDLEAGRVDILIGTHRLLQSDVLFKDLGLLIIDEEQKFGVMHKEKLKKMRTAVDVLTLSATPIPRTLHIALSGIKDISIISTPPKDRLSVKTFVGTFSEDIIKEGIGRELRRGGQVYYIHNRIKTIRKIERFLRELLPDTRIEVAHGQMGEDDLDEVMKRFYRGGVDVLLCTAIVESGLDVPRANTMIVDRSHTFGLAQLYQLRGRIGRDRRRAYAYLIVPPKKSLSTEAVARLAAIEELSELGSGFQIASYDLDIRGGGDILGPDQSGHIQHVGYAMYVRFLEEAVAELQGKGKRGGTLPDAELNIPASIPDEYIQNPHAKLDFYRKIAMIRSRMDYEEVFAELTDRYGEITEPVFNLLNIALMRSDLSLEGVREIKYRRGKIFLSFETDSPVDRNHIARLVSEGEGKYGFDRRGIFFALSNFGGSNWDRLSSELNTILGKKVLQF